MENKSEITILLDFYSELLTTHQNEVMDMYYNHDLSLAEISESLQISRQAVHDIVKKSRVYLIFLESKLKLVAKYDLQMQKIEQANRHLDALETEWADHCLGEELMPYGIGRPDTDNDEKQNPRIRLEHIKKILNGLNEF